MAVVQELKKKKKRTKIRYTIHNHINKTAKRYQQKHTSPLNCTVSREIKYANSGVLEGGYESCVSVLTVGRSPVTLLFVVAIAWFGERKMPFTF